MIKSCRVYCVLHHNKINARALIGQSAMVIVPVNPWKFREEFVNYSPAARDLPILLVFFKHPAWFISL